MQFWGLCVLSENNIWAHLGRDPKRVQIGPRWSQSVPHWAQRVPHGPKGSIWRSKADQRGPWFLLGTHAAIPIGGGGGYSYPLLVMPQEIPLGGVRTRPQGGSGTQVAGPPCRPQVENHTLSKFGPTPCPRSDPHCVQVWTHTVSKVRPTPCPSVDPHRVQVWTPHRVL